MHTKSEKLKFRSLDLLKVIEDNKDLLKPPVNNKVLWEDSEFIVMLLGGPNRRRDFHVDPSDELFYQIKGSCYVECINDKGEREVVEVKEGEMFMLPANVPHSPHRIADTYGIVVERKRAEGELEDFVWFCNHCNQEMHKVTIQLTNIEVQVKQAIENFNANKDLRTCAACGHLMPEEVGVWECE
ncbi:3-hydroxyanthranilate 3,4-dioxygenase [Cytobacillus horneckiae]|uniref:3-hydroxyanthranilate 3,4-dioxygenase n=1 Tax=Cytobacillus horneckiae TaxID=549687 RepID=A0A2N0ZA95_9BACI|nr:3-hydroxyanthranilate 3,4-dioxygenase [Cytobacillus horneckiae]MBN6886797.1 3-hydroxyanthranilate 3,4-dioxygenase [Cytobacillus horneckiae]MCM3177732.1 3-hydroxyanthranilate 3,4-dioxygenase [Cytobacillus horneckiae]MEC1158047.1 3-hydroxyanthranilate 3,4-dioxygenase [Cytobacillus horneckiae]MED2937028.1 3-hydroxyanthranilate 3,4-dioxygenase [Cytobacillus horneckiae]PKG26436.1 3-hydroxyanthranilate 3,4-dioxygenase [Cytobacillus horneckiae]